jgi:hypothetical protein
MRHQPLGISLKRYLTEAKVAGEKPTRIKTSFSRSNHDRGHGFFKLENLPLHLTSSACLGCTRMGTRGRKKSFRPAPRSRLLPGGFFCMVMHIVMAASCDFELWPRAGWPGAPNNRCVFNLIFPGKNLTHEPIEPASIHG